VAVALATIAIGVALARPHELRVEADDARAHRFLRYFGAPFVRQGVSGRWSGVDSALVLHGVGAGRSDLVLGISGGMPGRAQSFSLVPGPGARAAAVEPAAFVVAAGGWQEYRVRLVVPRWPPSVAPVELSLRTEPYRRGADGSALGVRFTGLSVRPADGPLARFASALPVAAVWGWALALAAILARKAGGRLVSPPAMDRLLAAAAGAGGLALCALGWRDPHLFAWLTPPLPATCALVTTLLCLSAAANRLSAQPSSERARAVMLVAFLALVVLYVQRGGAVPALTALAAAGAWMAARLRTSAATAEAEPARMGRLIWVALGAVVIVGVAMRFLWIRDLPYGLWRDDARYGLAALEMIEEPRYRPGYLLEINLPRLGIQMLGLGLQAFGITSWSMRTVPALAGALTVVALFGLARRLSGRNDVALLAAAFLAASSWHSTVSRLTSPAALHPFFEVLGLWCLAEAWHVGRSGALPRPWRAILLLAGGACIGLSLQTYISGRAAVLTAGALVAVWWWPARRGGSRRWADLALVAAGFALAGAPLLGYAWRDWRSFNARTAMIFVPTAAVADASSPVGAVDASLGRHLLMFNVRGESNGRRNVPLRPMLDPVTGLGFVVGLLASWRARGDPAARFLLGALALALLPSALAIEGPHSVRAIGAIAFACMIAAVGWNVLVDGLAPRARAGAMAGVAAVSLALNAWTYFTVGARDERVWRAFYAVETAVGAFVRDLAEREGPSAVAAVHLSPGMAADSVVEFLVHGLPVKLHEDVLAVRPAPDAVFVVARDDERERLFDIAAERGLGTPELAGLGPPLPDQRPAFSLYRLP
jgi:4-amino-4-deoxy-L-arabinose transferase-like glycosyltransferase